MDIQEKGLHYFQQAQSRGICECPLDFFKGFLLFPFSPLCGFIEEFGQERAVRDPDTAETCSSQKLSDLPAGLKGLDGTACFFSGLSLHSPWDR
jgi:hypothetical protein